MKGQFADKIRDSAEDLIKDKKALLKILSIAVILLLALIIRMHDSKSDTITVEAAENTDENAYVNEELCVDIGGAVYSPGVYNVKAGTRLYEVIELAGGLRSDADTNLINQASVVEDGQKIIIPIASNNAQETEGAKSISGPDPLSYAGDMTSNGFVNINTASKDELMELSGIGDVIAERIIEYRTQSRFESKEDIMSVKGIGSSIYDKIKERIIV